MPPKLKQTNSFAIQIVYDSLKSKIAYLGAGSWGRASGRAEGAFTELPLYAGRTKPEVPTMQPGVCAARWRMR